MILTRSILHKKSSFHNWGVVKISSFFTLCGSWRFLRRYPSCCGGFSWIWKGWMWTFFCNEVEESSCHVLFSCKVSCQWERRDLLHGACLANGSSDIPSTSAVSPLVMAAPMHAGHVIMFLAIGDGDTFISPLLPATPLQKQTPSVNTFRRDPVW